MHQQRGETRCGVCCNLAVRPVTHKLQENPRLGPEPISSESGLEVKGATPHRRRGVLAEKTIPINGRQCGATNMEDHEHHECPLEVRVGSHATCTTAGRTLLLAVSIHSLHPRVVVYFFVYKYFTLP